MNDCMAFHLLDQPRRRQSGPGRCRRRHCRGNRRRTVGGQRADVMAALSRVLSPGAQRQQASDSALIERSRDLAVFTIAVDPPNLIATTVRLEETAAEV